MCRFDIIIFGLLFVSCPLTLCSQNIKTILGEGIISTESVEYGCTFSADGEEVYFVRSGDPWGSPGSGSTIYHSKKNTNYWSEPEIASFSGSFNDSDPHLTKDGTTLYFISDRGSTATNSSQDIWRVEKGSDNKWGQPQRLAEPINSDAREYSPRTDGHGNLYFASDRVTGMGQGDLYVSRLEGGSFQFPENLGKSINSSAGEWNLEVSEEGDILIFEASGRKKNLSPYGDLYISFKKEGKWSEAQNLEELNTTGSDLYPLLRNNASLLYFSSSDSLQSKTTQIYSVPFKDILEAYRLKTVIPQD